MTAGARNADGSAFELSDKQRSELLAKYEARDIVASLEGIIEKHHSHDEAIADVVNALLLLAQRVTMLEQQQNPKKDNDNSTH